MFVRRVLGSVKVVAKELGPDSSMRSEFFDG